MLDLAVERLGLGWRGIGACGDYHIIDVSGVHMSGGK
jgi:hypothetical protein